MSVLAFAAHLQGVTFFAGSLGSRQNFAKTTSMAGLTLRGTEDWESSNLAPNMVTGFDDPLAPGVANGPFPMGTNSTLGLTVQSNTNGGAPATLSPYGIGGLTTASMTFLGTPSDQVSANSVNNSFDLIMSPAAQAIKLAPLYFNINATSSTEFLGDVEVRVYDSTNTFLGSTTVNNVGYDQLAFVGIIAGAGEDIGRVNLYTPTNSSQSVAGADDITIYDAPAPAPVLTTNPANGGSIQFGNVRIGTTSPSMNVTIQNTGDAGTLLNGAVADVAGAFSGPVGLSFSNIDTSTTLTTLYDMSPTAHGPYNDSVDVTSNGGDSSVALLGTGVGPEFTAIGDMSGMIDFGDVFIGDNGMLTLTIVNDSPDGDQGNLTDLTLLSYDISGGDAMLFGLTGFVGMPVLNVNGTIALPVFFAPDDVDVFSTTLTFVTDQNAAFGTPGDTFTFTLKGRGIQGQSNEPAIPEPATAALLLTGLLAVCGGRGRRARTSRAA